MFRFRLATLMLAVAACGFCCGVYLWGYQRGYLEGMSYTDQTTNGVRVKLVPVSAN